jgi:hypothetical protein
MSTPIIEKILGNNILANTYIKDTINLTKSINIKNDNEAKLYNDYIKLAYPSYVVDLSDKTTWRYYKHLMGEYHAVDTQIVITSLDNGTSIPLDSNILNLHRKTKKELLKFGLFYKQIIDLFPEQELYIKAVICDKRYNTIQEVIGLENFSIVSYATELVEENEHDLMYELQQAIDNYKNIRMIPYYTLSDNLFLASQYHVFYNFILMKILAIRLKNAKTLKAHTFHIKNYLASHHYLDESYTYLTKKQSLFLYRNLLYLDNHAGHNSTFNILIDKLFTDRNISLVNYIYKQENDTDDSDYIKYRCNQKLLNKADLVYSPNDFSLDNIKAKEVGLTHGNPKELTYNIKTIDHKFKNSLFSTLLTKDLETIIVDNTDTVRHKLIPTLIDYWAYLLKTNKMNYLVTIVDPVTNNELKLTTKDLFKLFVIVLYKSNNVELTDFPDYCIKRVFKENLPTTQQLIGMCYNPQYWYHDTIDDIRNSIPTYSFVTTSSQCQEYISSIYNLNIGIWLLTCNYSDKDINGQFEYMIERMCKSDTYTFNNETVQNFLIRIGISDLMTYDSSAMESMSYSILNNLYDNKLDFINSYKTIQKALVEVFKKFNSYTIQLINDYYSSSPTLCGPKDNRCSVSEDINSRLYYYDFFKLNIDMGYKILLDETLEFDQVINHGFSYLEKYELELLPKLEFGSKSTSKVDLLFNNKVVNDLGGSAWMVNQSSDDQLEFLALNL